MEENSWKLPLLNILGQLKDRLSLFNSTFVKNASASAFEPQVNQKKIEESSIYCLNVEKWVGRIIAELKEKGTFQSLQEIIKETNAFNGSQAKHFQKSDDKPEIMETEQHVSPSWSANVNPMEEKASDSVNPVRYSDAEMLSCLEDLMAFKISSEEEYNEHHLKEVNAEIEMYEFNSEIQVQVEQQKVSFWLLKLKHYFEEVDFMMRKTFDVWSEKEREIAILRKYRKLNAEKTARVKEMLSEKEIIIEKDRIEKELEMERLILEEKRNKAATLIQAFWRGTMVRKHLGPYRKKKKKKKKKGKKGVKGLKKNLKGRKK